LVARGKLTASKKECDEFSKYLKEEGGILKPDGIFCGMAYSDILREWLIWLHSDSPFYRGYAGEICYMSGNVSYINDKDTGFRRQADKFQNRSRNKDDQIFRGDVISHETPIFVPVISSFYSVGEKSIYDGGTLESIGDCQFVCRRDIKEGGMTWCQLRKKGCEQPIDLDDNSCYVESTSFKMTVTEDSPLKEYFEMPIEPGTYDTFAAAKVLLITQLPEGEYRLQYGGFGRGSYKSDSVHDFIVRETKGLTPPDMKITIPSHDDLERL
jgi:hypothetical protein